MLRILAHFTEKSGLDKQIELQIANFLNNNYSELVTRVESDSMIDDLPPTLKEEVFFHVFGVIIQRFNFLRMNQAEEGFKWAVVRKFR